MAQETLNQTYLQCLEEFYELGKIHLTIYHQIIHNSITRHKQRQEYPWISGYSSQDNDSSSIPVEVIEFGRLLSKHADFMIRNLEEVFLEQCLSFSLYRFQQLQIAVAAVTPFSLILDEFQCNHDQALLQLLQHSFSMDSFRPLQLGAINASIAQKHIIVVFPTGFGKSLIYQLPAAYQFGVTLVFSPLCSLISDQVRRLEELGIKTVWIRSGLTVNEEDHILACLNMRYPKYRVVFLTPEKFNGSRKIQTTFDNLYRRNYLLRIVLDEGHCVTQWGHTFRPSYLKLCKVRSLYPNAPLVILTATVTGKALLDIRHLLQVHDCLVFKHSLNRPNLSFNVVKKSSTVVKAIITLIKDLYPDSYGIIYCRTKRDCQTVSQQLQTDGINSRHYHSEVPQDAKDMVLEGWSNGSIQVVVATIAFGLGRFGMCCCYVVCMIVNSMSSTE